MAAAQKKQYAVAIDGPSAAGKSGLARTVAAELGFVYVDTGALYRAVGLYAVRNGAEPSDAAAVEKLLPDVSLTIEYGDDGAQHVFLCGEDVSEAIRQNEVSRYASDVSKHPAVRAFLLELQRGMARTHDVVMDGRDIGTVILPSADVKIFLTAAPEKRAQRRYKELLEKGQSVTLEEIRRDMEERDRNDSMRSVAPAVPAADAVYYDNSDDTPEETAAHALSIIRGRIGLKK